MLFSFHWIQFISRNTLSAMLNMVAAYYLNEFVRRGYFFGRLEMCVCVREHAELGGSHLAAHYFHSTTSTQFDITLLQCSRCSLTNIGVRTRTRERKFSYSVNDFPSISI